LIFELTEQSPLIYFDAIDRRAFFQPLGSHPYLPEAGQYDERINLRRQKFIEICVEKVGTDHSGIPTMKALNVDDTIPGTYTFSSRDKKLDQKFLIRFIADEWKLDIGALQIKVFPSMICTIMNTN
jgi:hypothetical protein